MQKFKSIYFKDYLVSEKESNSFTISFTDDDQEIYQKVYSLPSSKIRELLELELYTQLLTKSQKEGLTPSRYCVWKLKRKLNLLTERQQLGLFAIDSKYVNFETSKNTPFQSWYPYLEGYAPQFVSEIYNKYFNGARSIYDPFSGTGTTPFTIAEFGINAYYSEINPLLRYLTEVKIEAKSIENKSTVLEEIDKLIHVIKRGVGTYVEDGSIKKAYTEVFGDSKFFDDLTLNTLFKVKTYSRKLNFENKFIANLLNIAVIGNIVKCSQLKRQGDLRFKTKVELLKTPPLNIIDEITESLLKMRDDIAGASILKIKPILITEDARNFGQVKDLSIDGVITSPPYLNGTNYFRNTKLELWYLDYLKNNQDLRSFRDLAVTSGINDVSLKRNTKCVHESLLPILEKLNLNAYDKRIPKMVNDYFYDMYTIFSGINEKLSNGSRMAIDLGDSIYSGVHVPTDEILTNILNDIGFKLEDEVVLRKRISKGGDELKQVLLIYKKNNSLTKKVFNGSHVNYHWEDSWKLFKNNLPHQKLPFSKRNWGDPMHSLCSYQGKLKPSIAYNLIKTFVPSNGRMLDPFVGVGTIPLEAALGGITSFGFDISPTAEIISRAKVSLLERKKVESELVELEKYIKSKVVTEDEIQECKTFGLNKKVIDYYHQETLKEIILARRYFKSQNKNDPNVAYVMSCLMHVLHGNRPYALSRRSHGITPFAPTGEFIYKNLIEKTREKAYRNFPLYMPNFKEGKIFFQDATKTWPSEINNLDAIITSPPFFDSTRFYSANWLRLWFAGWSEDMFKSEPLNFIDELQKKDLSIYDNIFRQAKERLKPNGVLVLHLGKSKKCDMAKELSKKAETWFRTYDIFEENVENCEKHGIKDKGTVVEHQYLVLI